MMNEEIFCLICGTRNHDLASSSSRLGYLHQIWVRVQIYAADSRNDPQPSDDYSLNPPPLRAMLSEFHILRPAFQSRRLRSRRPASCSLTCRPVDIRSRNSRFRRNSSSLRSAWSTKMIRRRWVLERP